MFVHRKPSIHSPASFILSHPILSRGHNLSSPKLSPHPCFLQKALSASSMICYTELFVMSCLLACALDTEIGLWSEIWNQVKQQHVWRALSSNSGEIRGAVTALNNAHCRSVDTDQLWRPGKRLKRVKERVGKGIQEWSVNIKKETIQTTNFWQNRV